MYETTVYLLAAKISTISRFALDAPGFLFKLSVNVELVRETGFVFGGVHQDALRTGMVFEIKWRTQSNRESGVRSS